ncbi:MAG: PqqD family protein [Sphingomonadales bacterium]
MGKSYRLNEPDVTAKVMDGEAVIIHLGTGIYYSMDGVGCAVWECITAGGDVDAIAGSLADRYGIDRSVASADVGRLIEDLIDQQLVVPADGTHAATGLDAAPAAYTAPALNRYDDMAELLALDPPLPAAPR